jgi:hypothetical protein
MGLAQKKNDPIAGYQFQVCVAAFAGVSALP